MSVEIIDLEKINSILSVISKHLDEHKKSRALSKNYHDHEEFLLAMRSLLDDYEDAIGGEVYEKSDNSDDVAESTDNESIDKSDENKSESSDSHEE